jgi:hypothetical protein
VIEQANKNRDVVLSDLLSGQIDLREVLQGRYSASLEECYEGLQGARKRKSALQLVGLENINQNDSADFSRDECRQATIKYLQAAEKTKRTFYSEHFWFGLGVPYINMAHRRIVLATIIFCSLLLSIACAASEDYPGIVKKPLILKLVTAGAVLIKLALHAGLFILPGDAERWERHSRIIVFVGGIFCAAIKLVECGLICHFVDHKFPTTLAGKYCLVAQGLADGLMAAAAGMAHDIEKVPLDAEGKVFHHLGHHSYCPSLTIAEKRCLLDAIIFKLVCREIDI